MVKNFKIIVRVALLFGFFSSFSQNNIKVEARKTKIETYTYEKDGKLINYSLKIIEKRKPRVQLSDRQNCNSNYVTKLISIDNDADKSYDRFLVLRYRRSPKESFELIPTPKGFAILANNKRVDYTMGEGTHIINDNDYGYFTIDEFDKY